MNIKFSDSALLYLDLVTWNESLVVCLDLLGDGYVKLNLIKFKNMNYLWNFNNIYERLIRGLSILSKIIMVRNLLVENLKKKQKSFIIHFWKFY